MILVSIYLSVYSITNLHGSVQECQIFLHQKKHPDCFFSWVLPTPGRWNKFGFCGNSIDVDGIGLGAAALLHCALPQAFLFADLQILCQPLSVEDGELSLGNTLFVFVTFRYWRFRPSITFVVYIMRLTSSGNWKKELTSSQLFSQLLTA